MKVKEMPLSLMQSLKLYLTSSQKLGQHAEPIDKPLIVSLTSIESRLRIVQLTIRSLLNQNTRPEKILLWLNHSLEKQVPDGLSDLQGERFEIRYSDQNCPHRKLVETLTRYPDHIIVTCDDDVMYPSDWLSRLYQQHKQSPNDIVAHECRRIAISPDNEEVLPYKEWRFEQAGEGSPATLAIGYGGVLYPPNSLHSDTSNRTLYDELAPRVDDLWFKAMALRAGTQVRRTVNNRPKPTPILFSQTFSLKKENIGADKNRKQWQILEKQFQLNQYITNKAQ